MINGKSINGMIVDLTEYYDSGRTSKVEAGRFRFEGMMATGHDASIKVQLFPTNEEDLAENLKKKLPNYKPVENKPMESDPKNEDSDKNRDKKSTFCSIL